jgi:hypothetical protein
LGLGPEHDALVALARSLAVAVDMSLEQDAGLWREYRQALKALAEAGVSGGDDGGAAAFLVSISTPRRAEMGDSETS